MLGCGQRCGYEDALSGRLLGRALLPHPDEATPLHSGFGGVLVANMSSRSPRTFVEALQSGKGGADSPMLSRRDERPCGGEDLELRLRFVEGAIEAN